MNRLYIIGNGFDRYHALPTQYSDFHRFLIANDADFVNYLETYFQFNFDKCNEYLWTCFEDDLATFDSEFFMESYKNFDVLDDDFKPRFFYGLDGELSQETEELVDKVKEAFWDWLNEVDLDPIQKRLNLDDNSIFLTFNYTLTLEKIYHIPDDRIFHIHGDVVNHPGNLIFGHNEDIIEEEPELDENGDSNRSMSSDSEATSKFPFHAFYKPVSNIIAENRDYFKGLSQIEEIIILGHSLNPTDIPYFKVINRQTPNATWKVSYHTEREKDKHLKNLLDMGMDRNRIKLFKMD